MVRTVLAGLLAAPALVVVLGTPAAACSCAEATPQGHLERADAVFVGEVVGRIASEPTVTPDRAYGKVTYTVRVDRVFKGEVTAVQEVLTPSDLSTCGRVLPPSGPALIFGRTDVVFDLVPAPGQLIAGGCAGTRAGAEVPASFGVGAPPRPAAPTPGLTPAALPGDSSGPAPGLLALAAVPVLAAVGLAARRVRRRPRPAPSRES